MCKSISETVEKSLNDRIFNRAKPYFVVRYGFRYYVLESVNKGLPTDVVFGLKNNLSFFLKSKADRMCKQLCNAYYTGVIDQSIRETSIREKEKNK
jgi:hypothetical protein